MKQLVILAGQSNMRGHGILAELESDALPSNARLFDFNPLPGCFGPEIGFARRFVKRQPSEELWLLKYAVGGSAMPAWRPDWSAEDAALTFDDDKGPLYQRLLRHYAQLTQETDARLWAILWMQGESDSRFAHAAAQYESNLRQFVLRLRVDVGAPDLPFAMGLVDPPGTHCHAAKVRAAQRRIADGMPHVALVDSAGLSKHDDDLHYDTDGQLELGRRFADALLANME